MKKISFTTSQEFWTAFIRRPHPSPWIVSMVKQKTIINQYWVQYNQVKLINHDRQTCLLLHHCFWKCFNVFALQTNGRLMISLIQKWKSEEERPPTLARVLKVLKAPVLKITLFFWQKMKATMPMTTISRKRGVRMARIHRLLGGVFTTAANTPEKTDHSSNNSEHLYKTESRC